MIRRPHLKLVATHSVRNSLRGGSGLIAILATLVIGLVMASIAVAPLEAADRVAAQQPNMAAADKAVAKTSAEHEAAQITTKVMGWAIGASSDQMDYLANDKPGLISALLVLLAFVTPLFACLGAFNQTSGDIASKGLRYLVIRTERANIFFGRFLGTALFTVAVLAGLFVILGIYCALKIDVYSTSAMLLWLGGGYLRLVALSLPYVALCAWISGSIDSPMGSLAVSLLLTYMWPLIVFVGSASTPAVAYAQYATPWGFKWWLFAPSVLEVGGAVLIMLGFTALLLWVGGRHFDRRDL